MKLYISHNIKYLLEKNKWDHATFAAQFDISRSSVSTYISEKAIPKIETLIKIANYFNMQLDQLIRLDIQKQDYIEESGTVIDKNEKENSLLNQLKASKLLTQQKEKNILNLEKIISLLEERIDITGTLDVKAKPNKAV
jgi:transcriptional regulator with XRE-family HTH domain